MWGQVNLHSGRPTFEQTLQYLWCLDWDLYYHGEILADLGEKDVKSQWNKSSGIGTVCPVLMLKSPGLGSQSHQSFWFEILQSSQHWLNVCKAPQPRTGHLYPFWPSPLSLLPAFPVTCFQIIFSTAVRKLDLTHVSNSEGTHGARSTCHKQEAEKDKDMACTRDHAAPKEQGTGKTVHVPKTPM